MHDADSAFMQIALDEAEAAKSAGEVPVGAVLVADGSVLGQGQNRSIRDADPSAHAEVVALRAASAARNNHRLPDTTLYVTLEPCAMCVGAIVQARVLRVVFGAYDPKAGALGSCIDLADSPAFNHRFEIQGGLMADACGVLLKEFFAAKR